MTDAAYDAAIVAAYDAAIAAARDSADPDPYTSQPSRLP